MKLRNTGTIRNDFEELSEDEAVEQKRSPYIDKETSPGPGKYLNASMLTTIGQSPIPHRHPGHFGVTEGRFREKPSGGPLGPG